MPLRVKFGLALVLLGLLAGCSSADPIAACPDGETGQGRDTADVLGSLRDRVQWSHALVSVSELEYLDRWVWPDGECNERWVGVIEEVLAVRDETTAFAAGERVVVRFGEAQEAEPGAGDSPIDPPAGLRVFLAPINAADVQAFDFWHTGLVISGDGALVWPREPVRPFVDEHAAWLDWMGGFSDARLVEYAQATYVQGRSPDIDWP